MILAVLLFVMPLVEISAIIAVGQVIGLWPTVILLVLESALGAWLVRRCTHLMAFADPFRQARFR